MQDDYIITSNGKIITLEEVKENSTQSQNTITVDPTFS